ncbi:MAG TPA: DedA family protein/thiosulfate sulfurtransferase GlpE [Casimicrobiaceae bacterium]|nr:DedA family protein/thiosulfate sulfurtransferase GlpE [Casimicrobiaceae bacterium]
MTHDLIPLLSQYGLAIVFANVLIEQIGVPVPAIPTLVIAGALAAEGKLSGPLVFAVAIAACSLADVAWYLAGRRFGNGVMKMLCRISLTPDFCVSETQARFERWGVNALVIAKFVPGLATIAPPLAGATRIGWPQFLVFNTLGATLWVGAGLGGGMLLGPQMEWLLTRLDAIGSVAIVIIVALLAAYIAFKWWERRRFFTMLRMARIGVDELYRLIDAGLKPVIVDVRSPTARALEPRRIPGALHVPLHAVDHHVKDLPRDREIILYCTCPNEASAAQVAKILMNSGFAKVRPLHGGLDAWIEAGYEVEDLPAAEAIVVVSAPSENAGKA